MLVTDPIADMLTRVRNAIHARKDKIEVPASNVKRAIARILLEEGYIRRYEVFADKKQGKIVIWLKYLDKNNNAISGLRRISKPGLRKYAGGYELPKVLRGLGIAIISTSKGIMTDKQARNERVGGEVMAYIW